MKKMLLVLGLIRRRMVLIILVGFALFTALPSSARADGYWATVSHPGHYETVTVPGYWETINHPGYDEVVIVSPGYSTEEIDENGVTYTVYHPEVVATVHVEAYDETIWVESSEVQVWVDGYDEWVWVEG